VFAAFQAGEARAALLDAIELRQLTPRTLTRRADVDREWTLVARRGIALNREESIVGAVFLAAPIFDADRNACASISVGVPRARYTPAIGRRIGEHLKAGCARLSEVLHAGSYVHEDCRLKELRRRPGE
jgi:DNA-binding IclR family transcriptional regulator